MRRIAAVLALLLTATAAHAGGEDTYVVEAGMAVVGVACCGTLPLVIPVAVIVSLTIYDRHEARRKAARRRELMNRTPGGDE